MAKWQDCDTSTPENWARTWLDKAEAQIASPAPAYLNEDGSVDKFGLVCDLWADLPWTPDEYDRVEKVLMGDPRWPAIDAFGQEAEEGRVPRP